MATTNYKELLDAGVHFGHLTRKWDPKMAPYIFMEKNGILDQNKIFAGQIIELPNAAAIVANSLPPVPTATPAPAAVPAI